VQTYPFIEQFISFVEKLPKKPEPKPPVTKSCPGRKSDPGSMMFIEDIELDCINGQRN
jgi:hypothetical protein